MEHYFTNNQNLKSELRDIDFSFDAYNFTFKSDNGVFSKNKIDYASLFLVKTFFATNFLTTSIALDEVQHTSQSAFTSAVELI